MTRLTFDPPSEPPDGDPVCRICDHEMELTLVGWECTYDHDALDEEPEKHPHAGCYTE